MLNISDEISRFFSLIIRAFVLQAQTSIVAEMKNALMRSLALPECTAKHNKIQALTGRPWVYVFLCKLSPSPQLKNQLLPHYIIFFFSRRILKIRYFLGYLVSKGRGGGSCLLIK